MKNKNTRNKAFKKRVLRRLVTLIERQHSNFLLYAVLLFF